MDAVTIIEVLIKSSKGILPFFVVVYFVFFR